MAVSPDARRGGGVVTLVVALVAFIATLQWVYADRIAPLFAYSGLTYHSPDRTTYAAAIAITVGLALVLPRQVRRPSDFIQWVLFGIAVAPCILVSQYNTFLTPVAALRYSVAVACCVLLIRAATAIGLPRLMLRMQSRSPRPIGAWLWPVVAALSLANYLFLAATAGIHLSYLSFSDVYSVRSDFVTSSSSFPLVGYLVPLQYGVINPLLITKGLLSRRRPILAMGVIGQLLIYASTGQKTVLFSVVALAGLIAVLRRHALTGARIIGAAALLAIGCALIDMVRGSTGLTNLFTRRFLVVPGILAAAYYAIFADKPKTHFSEFLPSANPYPTNPPSHIVGQLFVGDSGTNANVSWLGHGFLSWGYGGMIVESLVIVVLLCLADALSRGLPLAVSCATFFMPTIALTSASAFTTILTDGFAAALIIAWRMPRTGWEPRVSKARRRQTDEPRRIPPSRTRTPRPPRVAEEELSPAWARAFGGD